MFGDVERLLDSGAKLPAEPVPLDAPTPALKAPKFGSFVDLVSPLMRRSELDLPTDEQDYDALLAQEAAQQTTGRSLTRQPLLKTVRESVRSYDRLLLGVGSLSLLAILVAWDVEPTGTATDLRPFAIAPQTATSNPIPAATDNQFVTYLQQALKAIDQQQPSGNPSGSNGVASATDRAATR